MSKFTPADAAYIKGSVRKIIQLTAIGGVGLAKDAWPKEDIAERNAELARLEAFIDGCTLESKGNGHY